MSSDSERELDSLLNSRLQLQPHENLAQRIVEAARVREQKARMTNLQWLNRFFFEYFHCEPAYVWVFVLLLGLCQGYIITGVSQEYHTDETRIGNTQDYFYSTSSYL